MKSDDLKREISEIRAWKHSGERVPHKPLLILYALGRVARSQSREMSYEDVKEDLRKLLVGFGSYRQTVTIKTSTYSNHRPPVRQ